MKITCRFVPFKDDEVQKDASAVGKFVFEGTDFASIAKSIAKKVQLFESKTNADPQSPDRNRIWFTVSKVENTHIPPVYIEADLNDYIGEFMTAGEWDFWSPQ